MDIVYIVKIGLRMGPEINILAKGILKLNLLIQLENKKNFSLCFSHDLILGILSIDNMDQMINNL